MTINAKAFTGVDLNLLIIFLIVFREENVSRAAQYLGVNQPAVSGSLARLRRYFDDPLFVRRGRFMRPTHKARQIAEMLIPAMQQIEGVISLFDQTKKGDVHGSETATTDRRSGNPAGSYQVLPGD
jgi:DNA-binding transcriptional LysR family regulator